MKKLSMIMLGVLAATPAWAQTEMPARLSIQRTTASDSTILSVGRSQDPGEVPVPKFVVKSDDNKFMLTIGGKVGVIMGSDIGNNLYNTDAGINFTTQMIPVPAKDGHRGDFYINPLANTAIDFQIVGFGGTPDQVTAYMKLNTNGMSNSLKLSKAYLSWRGFTVGKKSTLLKDGGACQPPTIDPEGPAGCVSTGVYEAGYTSPDLDGFRFAIGVDIPTWYSSNGVYRGKDYPEFDGKQVANYADAEQIVPDVPMWVQYGSSENNRIRLSGIIRNFSYRDLVAGKTRHMVGWGTMLSGNLNPVKPLVFYYQLAYGKGIGAYLQDIAGMPLSFIPSNSSPGRMDASPMMGANIGLTYNINSKWQVNLMASESRIWDVKDYAIQSDASNYKYALYCGGNVFCQITPYMQWGVEYLWGHRQTWNMGGANDSRIQTQILFTI